MQKTYTLYLPYFKQGDDLAHYLENTKTVSEAFAAHADCMQDASRILERLAKVAKSIDMSIEGCTHSISITGEETDMEPLVTEGLLVLGDFDPDEDCE